MKKRILVFAVLAAVLALFSLSFPHTAVSQSAVLFFDNFNSGSLSQWHVVTGDWGVEQGQLRGHGHGGYRDAWIYTAENYLWTDYSLSAKVDFETGNAELVVRSTGHWQNEYRVQLWSQTSPRYANRYQIMRYKEGNFFSFTAQRSGNVDGNAPSPVPITDPADVKVEVVGNTLTVYVNGMLVDQITDTNPLSAGTVGLGVIWDWRGGFDDVEVRGIGPETIVSDTNTEYLSESGWVPAVLAYVNPAWPSLPEASWIWKSYLVSPDESLHGTNIVAFRRRFTLSSGVQNAAGTIQITADNAYELSINGTVVGRDGVLDPSGADFGWQTVETYHFTALPGENEILVRAISYRSQTSDPRLNTAGVLFRAEIIRQDVPDLNFGYVGAIQSVRGAPLIANKETAIEVDVAKRGGPAVQGVRVNVLANGFPCYFFYVKEEATAETEWKLTQPHETVDLPAGDCQRTIYFFAGDRRLVPTEAGAAAYNIDAQITTPGNNSNSVSITQDVMDARWGDDPQFKVLVISADWDFLDFPKDNYLVQAARDLRAHAQSCFPFADEGETVLSVSSSFDEQSTEKPPRGVPRSRWPAKGELLGLWRLAAWLAEQRVVWGLRTVGYDRWALLVPEEWFAKRVGEIEVKPGVWAVPGGINLGLAKKLLVAEANQITGYANRTPGFIISHELAHSFWLDEHGGETPIANALDVRNRRVMSNSSDHKVADVLNARLTTDYSDDRWLLKEDYIAIAHGGKDPWWPPTPEPLSASDHRGILISALLFADGNVEVLPWYVLDPADVDINLIPEGNEYFLEYLNASGQVIYSRGFPNLMAPDGVELEISPLVFTAPYLNGVKTIRLRRQAETVFQREVSANPPSVTITNPSSGTILANEVEIKWSASDADGGDLLCSLTAYGEEEGNIWPLADGLGGSSFAWDTTKLPVGRYRLEALVTDGVNTARHSVWVRKIQRTNLPLILNPPQPTPTLTATPTATSTPRPTVTPLPTATSAVQNVGRVWGHVYSLETGQVKPGVTFCIGPIWKGQVWLTSTSDEDGAIKFWWLPIDPVSGLDCAVWVCENESCFTQIHLTLQSPERGGLQFWLDEGKSGLIDKMCW